MASDDQVINSISSSLKDLEATLTRFVAKTEASTKKFENAMAGMGASARKAGTEVSRGLNTAANASVQSAGKIQGAAQNLSFQLNDMGSTLLTGASPFTVMMQQGSQVSQVLNGLRGSGISMGAALTGAITSVLNPISLLTYGVIFLAGYAVQFFQNWVTGGKSAKKETEDLMDAVNELRKSQGLKPVSVDESRANQMAQINEKTKTLTESTKALNKTFEEFKSATGAQGEIAPKELLRPGEFELITKMKGEIDRLASGMKAGFPDFVGFAERMQAIKIPPELADDFEVAKQGMIDLALAAGLDDAKISELKLVLSGAAKSSDDHAEALKREQKAADENRKAMETQLEIIRSMGPGISEIEKLWAAYVAAMAKATTAQDEMNIKTQTWLALQKQIATAQSGLNGLMSNTTKIWDDYWTGFHDDLDAAGGDLDTYLAQIDKAEGRAKNKRSSAQGFGQFIDSTWIAEIKQHRPDLAAAAGFDDAAILKLRSNVTLAKEITRRFAEDNQKDLLAAGEKATVANLHLAHFLGSAGAVATLKAAPGTPVEQFLGAKAIRDNPEVLGGGKTREDVLAYARGRAGMSTATREQKSAVDELTSSMEAEIAQTERQNAINADSKTTVDEKTFALLKEEALTKLLTAAQKDNTTVTAEQHKQFEALATKMATAGLSADQIKQKTEEATKALNDQKQATEQLASKYNDMASSAITGFIEDMRHGVSAGEAFSKMIDNLISQLIQMAIQQAVIKSGFGTFLAGVSGGGAKTGGKVGFGNLALQSGIGGPSYQRGGMVGRDPTAFNITAHKGEIVIPTRALQKAATQTKQPDHTSIDARSNIKVDIANGTGKTNTTTNGGVAFSEAVDKAVQMVIVRESRPGGLLRRPQGAR